VRLVPIRELSPPPRGHHLTVPPRTPATHYKSATEVT
jgi:hypothetical protein